MLDNQIDYKLWNVGWDMWEHWNGALHNSLQVQQHIVVSQINDQIWAHNALHVSTHGTPTKSCACSQTTMVEFRGGYCMEILPQSWQLLVRAVVYAGMGDYLIRGNIIAKSTYSNTWLRGTLNMRVSEIGNDNQFLLFWSFHYLVQPRLKWGD